MAATIQARVIPLRPATEWNDVRRLARPSMAERDVRYFPTAAGRPDRTLRLRDELLELYAFRFSQGGFRELGLTFEQFLHVAATLDLSTRRRFDEN